MARIVLIESRDPFASSDTTQILDLANGLAAQGEDVTLFLVENGVLATRAAIADNPLAAVVGTKVEVVADAFSLRERGIDGAEQIQGIEAVDMDVLVDKIMDQPNTRVIWH